MNLRSKNPFRDLSRTAIYKKIFGHMETSQDNVKLGLDFSQHLPSQRTDTVSGKSTQ